MIKNNTVYDILCIVLQNLIFILIYKYKQQQQQIIYYYPVF